MARAFSLAVWNVEHFRDGDGVRVARVVDFLHDEVPMVPEVFAIFEVEGKEVYRELMKKFPDHRFHQSEGMQLQEILVGVHKDFPSFVTQRIEFKSQNDDLRPGLLLSLVVDGETYTVLFLHVKSGDTPYALGLRFDMMERCFDLRKALDQAAQGTGTSHFLVVGDFNTMGGYAYPYMDTQKRVTAEDEIERLATTARRRHMKLLTKDEPVTFSNDPTEPGSDLDHVVASDHLQFKQFNGRDVTVLGWPKQPSGEQLQWITDYSDHAVLYLEVQRI